MLVLALTSCNINDPILFQEKDANVAFDLANPSSNFKPQLNENDTHLLVPIVLAGKKGNSVTVSITAKSSGTVPAVEGKDYTITNKTLTFEEGYGIKYVEIKPIDNDVFEGNKTFTLTINEVSGLKLNTDNSLVITLLDDEHPYKALFGKWKVNYEDLFGDPSIQFEVNVAPDPNDTQVLIIEGFNVYYATPDIKMIVNSDGKSVYIPFQDGFTSKYGNYEIGYMELAGKGAILQKNTEGKITEQSIIFDDNFGGIFSAGGVNEGYWLFGYGNMTFTR